MPKDMLMLLAFLLFQIANASTIRKASNATLVKRQFSGAVFPLKLVAGRVGIEVINTMTQPNSDLFPQKMRMLVAGHCRKSVYFSNPSDGDRPTVTLELGLRKMHSEGGFIMKGSIASQRAPRMLQPGDPHGLFCVKSTNIPQNPFTELMHPFRTKVISFWFSTLEVSSNIDIPTIGEFSVGSLNEDRIDVGPRVRFPLLPLQVDPANMPNEWLTQTGVEILVGGRAVYDVPCYLTFDFEYIGLYLPKQVYNEVVKGLQLEKHQAIAESLDFIPNDLVTQVQDHLRTNRMRRFDCKDVNKIPDLQFGDLRISRNMLYVAKRNGKCQLTFEAVRTDEDEICYAAFGTSILRHWHFSVDFSVPGSEVAMFAPRKVGVDVEQNVDPSCFSKLRNLGECSVN